MTRRFSATRTAASCTPGANVARPLITGGRPRKSPSGGQEDDSSPPEPPTHGCGACQTSLQPGVTLAELALEYVRNCRKVRNEEFDLYREQPTLGSAIRKAVTSRKADWTLHAHQRTTSSRSLDELATLLLEIEPDIARCRSFRELHILVQQRARGVRGIGDVTVYDVALRIGMWRRLHLEPEAVYLHSRTHDGMKALGMERKGRTVPPSAFPPEFAPLRPREIEDLLCAFRDLLPKVNEGS